jgi:hypothetical protein
MTELTHQSPQQITEALDIPVLAITRKGEELTTAGRGARRTGASRVLSDARSEHP